MTVPPSYRSDFEARYQAVKAEVARVEARTVFDFGAHNGHFAVRLAQDLGCAVTAVDDRHHAPGHVTWVQRRVPVEGIRYLGRYDVVLALSVIHHFAAYEAAFAELRALARRVLIVEVPHPDERLDVVPTRHELEAVHGSVMRHLHRELVLSPATKQPELQRKTVAIAPLLRGRVFSGGGHHARSQQLYGDVFERELGYRPFMGSLNLRLEAAPDLGPEQVLLRPDKRRIYRLWRGRLVRWPEIQVNVMDVGDRGHGPECVELISNVRLRDLPGVEDGAEVECEIVW